MAIRQALGMSKVEFAERMAISDSRAGRLERAEIDGSLQLSTLRRAAEAVNCRLLYVLVPNEPLEDMVFRQAFLKAVEELGIPAVTALDADELSEELEEELEARTLHLVDRLGLWRRHPRRTRSSGSPRDPSPEGPGAPDVWSREAGSRPAEGGRSAALTPPW